MDRHDYMETLAGQIRWKRAVPMVERELETHIEEQKADFIASGMTESEAEAAAVAEMGDPVEVGVDMDRIHRPKMNWPAIAAIAFLSILGLAIRCYLDIHVDTGDGAGFPLARLRRALPVCWRVLQLWRESVFLTIRGLLTAPGSL